MTVALKRIMEERRKIKVLPFSTNFSSVYDYFLVILNFFMSCLDLEYLDINIKCGNIFRQLYAPIRSRTMNSVFNFSMKGSRIFYYLSMKFYYEKKNIKNHFFVTKQIVNKSVKLITLSTRVAKACEQSFFPQHRGHITHSSSICSYKCTRRSSE